MVDFSYCNWCNKRIKASHGYTRHLARCRRFQERRMVSEEPVGGDAIQSPLDGAAGADAFDATIDDAGSLEDPTTSIAGDAADTNANHTSQVSRNEDEEEGNEGSAPCADGGQDGQAFDDESEDADGENDTGLMADLRLEDGRTWDPEQPAFSTGQSDQTPVGLGHVGQAHSKPIAVGISKGRLSSERGRDKGRREEFRCKRGKAAGIGLRKDPSIDDERRADTNQGFASPVALAFARWFERENISRNAIARLLADPALASFKKDMGWNTVEDMLDTLRDVGTPLSLALAPWKKDTVGFKGAQYAYRWRSVEDAVRFFLGHEPFRDELVYAPYRAFSGDEPERRLYSDMASANWWWDTQCQIEHEGATVVPIIVASDKTQVTNHQGDEVAWPVYMTVGNLPARVRNSNQRPGSILLGELPVVKDGSVEDRMKILHDCLRKMFRPVMKAADGEGWNIRCADGLDRRCFPVVAVMAIDYEEQVKMTCITSNACPLCLVDLNQREDLEVRAKKRTPKSTRKQLRKQRQGLSARDDKWVKDVTNFTHGHKYANIYQGMMVDILHQLLKGVLMHALGWTIALLEDKLPKDSRRIQRLLARSGRKQTAGDRGKATQTDVKAAIDERFASIPSFKNIRIFNRVSLVKQWTGKQQKSILRVLVPVFAPLLDEAGCPDAIRFLRAMTDFMLLAHYRSHDDDTLRYMDLSLFRMNQYKETFRRYRPAIKRKDASDDVADFFDILAIDEGAPRGHFNFIKWHSMTHYVEQIELFGNAVDLSSEPFEYDHHETWKAPVRRTNRRDWQRQIWEQSSRRFNMLAAMDTAEFAVGYRRPTEADRREFAGQPVKPTVPVDPRKLFGWPIPEDGVDESVGRKWLLAREAAEYVDMPNRDFLQVLAVFVRESRGSSSAGEDPDAIEKDASWVEDMAIQFHPSIKCWKETGGDPDDAEAVESELMRCVPNWLAIRGNERCDWIWVQEYDLATAEDKSRIAFEGRLPAKMRFVISLRDDGRSLDDPVGQMSQYQQPTVRTGIFVELWEPDDGGCGRPDDVHGMSIIRPMRKSPRNGLLQGRRMYSLVSVHNGLHAVPVDETKPDGKMYVNNYADFATYNLCYEDDWEEGELQKARSQKEARANARAKMQKQKAIELKAAAAVKRAEYTDEQPHSSRGQKRRRGNTTRP